MNVQNIGSLKSSQYTIFWEDFFQFPLDSEINVNDKIKSLSTTDFKIWFDELCIEYREVCFAPILQWVAQIRGSYNPLTTSDSEADPIRSEYNQAILNTYKNIFDNVFKEKVDGLDMVIQKNKDWSENYLAELKEQSLNIEVNDHSFKAIAVCDVLWSGWECDSNAWVVVDNGIKKLVTSDHGTLSFTNPSFLEDKISEYKKAIEESEKLLLLIKE